MGEKCYHLISPSKNKVPILVSVPHSGTNFPKELLNDYHPHVIQHPADTDWFVDQLYNFAPELGITFIVAQFSRYVIDLNRDPKNQPLYPSERLETPLVPTQSFSGQDLYWKQTPDLNEIQRRIENYYTPYYQRISSTLNDLKSTFGQALFFDAHSIKHFVPSIQEKPFSQLTLSDYNGRCSHPRIAQQALNRLKSGPYTVSYNSVFLGGQLTRSMGQPANHIYSLQLEMCQNIYMDEEATQYLPEKALNVQNLLKLLFSDLIQTMESMKESVGIPVKSKTICKNMGHL